jgi:hypothetical protein
MSDEQKAFSEAESIRLPLDFYTPETLVSLFANHVAVQVSGDICRITFYDTVPPLFLSTSDEDLATKVSKITSIRAQAVARIAIELEKIPDFIRILQLMDGIRQSRASKAQDKEDIS